MDVMQVEEISQESFYEGDKQEMENHKKWKNTGNEEEKTTGNAAKEEFLRRTDEAAAWEEKFDLLGEHYRRYL